VPEDSRAHASAPEGQASAPGARSSSGKTGEAQASAPGARSSSGETGEESKVQPSPVSEGRAEPARRGKQSSVFRTYRKTIVLSLVAILFGVGAGVIFLGASPSPVAPSGGLTSFAVGANFVPFGANLSLTDLPSRNGIDVSADLFSLSRQAHGATLTVTVPATTWGGLTACAPPPARCILGLPGSNAKNAEFNFPSKPTLYLRTPQFTEYSLTVHVAIPNVGYNAAWNSEYVAATLPEFGVNTLQYPHGAKIPIRIFLRIPNAAKYSWTSGTSPRILGKDAAWNFDSPLGSAQVVNGVSLPEQDADTKWIFVAGALLGIAGGAFVGAIQEAVRPEGSARKSGGSA
jgi:hypothetical protein